MTDLVEVVVGTVEIVVVGAGEAEIIEIGGQVELIETGAQGPAGPPGGAGAGFVHTQASAATEWIINHNLGVRPSVSITDTGGQEIDADVVHMSVNQARIYFTTATAGQARLN